jgi:hypothetical protein
MRSAFEGFHEDAFASRAFTVLHKPFLFLGE